MMNVGQPPWHGLGTALQQPATATQAIVAAGLDWEVRKESLHLRDGTRFSKLEDHVAVVRSDPGAPSPIVLGIVGKNYTPLQNREAFRNMTRIQINQVRLEEYLNEVLPDPKDRENEQSVARIRNLRIAATSLFERGRGNDAPKVRGTLWAAYNGLTELVDHHTESRNSETRLAYACFGEGYLLKARAYRVAGEKSHLWKN